MANTPPAAPPPATQPKPASKPKPLDPNEPAILRNRDLDWLFDKFLLPLGKDIASIARSLEKLAAGATPAQPITVDIDAGDGDPSVRKNPKRWKGDSFAGRKFSECSADFLDVLAAANEYKADLEAADPEKKKWERGSRIEAAKARAWAKRKRANGETTSSSSSSEAGGFED